MLCQLSLHKGTETLVRDKEKFEIEGVRDRESQLYPPTSIHYHPLITDLRYISDPPIY